MTKHSTRVTILALIGIALYLSLCDQPSFGQTTVFTYQGKLTDNGVPANGNYDFEFRLFDALISGVQKGTTLTLTNVAVTNGVFTAQLDFAGCADCFNGQARFLDISVRVAGGGTFTPLAPRQAVTSNPYAIRSLSAASADGLSAVCAGCVTSSQITSVNGSSVTGTIPVASVPAGSANYIQNTTTQQSGNFNISGDGVAGGTLMGNSVSAATQFAIGSARILSSPGFTNLFAGVNAGADTTGIYNSFFGRDAGAHNTTGSFNSFFGGLAGFSNSGGTGGSNAFFGVSAGFSNTTGGGNSFFGGSSFNGTGYSNTTGNFNSFFGHRAGEQNVSGSTNSFFGTGAGFSNNGSSNTFLGHDAGYNNSSGSFNTVVGENADFFPNNRTNATAIGSKALVSQDNSLVLGSINGVNGANADTKVGIGTTTPEQTLHVNGSSEIMSTGDGAGFKFRDRGSTSPNDDWVWFSSGNVARFFRANIGDLLRISTIGVVQLYALGSSGVATLCQNAANEIAFCSSSKRYKSNIDNFDLGLGIVRRLRPVSFNWKADNTADFGLLAEEVAEVEPLLATRNDKGEIEGVKYDRLAIVLINAVKEQQAQIEQQQKLIAEQQKRIDGQQKQIDELKRMRREGRR